MRSIPATVVLVYLHCLSFFIYATNLSLEVEFPVANGFFIQDTGHIYVTLNTFMDESSSVLDKTLDEVASFSACSSLFQTLDSSPVLLTKHCHSLQDNQVEPSFDTYEKKPGSYCFVFELLDSFGALVTTKTVPFFFGRLPLQQFLLESNSKLLVLAIKYGVHGDDAKISVAWDGETIIDTPLNKVFRIDDVRTEMEQKSSAQHLSDDLVLKMATGFSCRTKQARNNFMRKENVETYDHVCDDSNIVQERWNEVASRLQKAIVLLLSEQPQINGQNVVFDAIFFISSPEDRLLSYKFPTALNFAQKAFTGLAWVFDDITTSVSNPGLVAWSPIDPPATSVDYDDQRSLGMSVDDKMSPLMAMSTDMTMMTRKLLRQLKNQDKPFTVCRPSSGWETTLAHRRLVSPWDKPGAVDVSLLEDSLGVSFNYVKSEDGNESDLNTYLDEWNEVHLMLCDMIAVYPSTAGRVADYCHLGVSSAELPPLLTGRSCHTVDGRMLAGVSQITQRDTWLEELKDLRVVVIDPLAATISAQYHKHSELLAQGLSGIFGDRYHNALPLFKDLITIEGPQKINQNSSNNLFSEVFAQWQQQLPHRDQFDIVLIGDVPFGALLSGYIRNQLNRSSIYMGEALSTQFAVLSDVTKNNEYRYVTNENWVHPL